MSLLAPFFLLGLGLLALPIWLHRLQTDNPERETFASTMFLEQSQKRIHVRRKIQHIILLVMRLLFLALLVFAFARPVFQTNSTVVATAGSRTHLLIVDSTASMSASSRYEDARSQARRLVNAADPGDRIQIYRFGPELTEVSSETLDRSLSLSAIDSLRPTPVSGDLGIMMAALSRLDWSRPLEYQVHILSDFQNTALPDRYADLIPDLPASAQISFHFHPLTASSTRNWFIDFVREEDGGLRVGVSGIGTPEQSLAVNVQVNEDQVVRMDIPVPESGRATQLVPDIDYQTGVNSVVVEILQQDELEADNRYHLVVDRQPPEPVLLLTSNPFSPAATYLSAVMSSVQPADSAGSRRTSYQVQPVSLAEFDARTLSRYSWLIVDDIGTIGSALEAELIAFVEAGGALISGAGEASLSLETMPVFGQSIQPPALAANSDFLSVAQVDQSHAMLNGLEGWSDLSVSRFVGMEALAGDDVLVRLENGAPLLIEQKVGRGKQLLLTSALDNQWNNLPVKPLYVSLMSRAANYLSGADDLESQLYGGDSFKLDEDAGGVGQLVNPNGKAVLALGNTNQSAIHMLDETGFYEVFTAARSALVGVNVHPSESKLAQIEATEIARWKSVLDGQGTGYQSTGDQGAMSELVANGGDANRREFWFVVLCAAALLLLVESLFANTRMTNRAGQTGGSKIVSKSADKGSNKGSSKGTNYAAT